MSPKQSYKCTKCDAIHAKWHGRCPDCQEYNCIEEYAAAPAPSAKGGSISSSFTPGARRSQAVLTPQGLNVLTPPPARATTHIPEFDRALGGGIVQGAVILLGGNPGIGKSTLLIQAAAAMSRDRKVIYISGEESLDQIQLRARRLGVQDADVGLIATQDCLAVTDLIETLPAGSLVIVDSMQTMDAGADSAPGSTTQVKNSAAHLIPAAKNTGVSLLLINQVTKDGSFAGPNILQHAVDTTLVLETDNSSGSYRIMRAEKNRFGETDEIGIFEMTSQGMKSITNPSEVFISQRDTDAFGSIIYPSIEGSRPLLIEIQALVSPTAFGTGRRSATGWDTSRLNMILATMSARLGIAMSEMDVYLNVAGGLKVSDPALDLAVVAALLSAYTQTPLPADLVAFGEVGLAGEVRHASRFDARLKEARQLGFNKALCPIKQGNKSPNSSCKGIKKIAQLLLEFPELSSAMKAA